MFDASTYGACKREEDNEVLQEHGGGGDVSLLGIDMQVNGVRREG